MLAHIQICKNGRNGAVKAPGIPSLMMGIQRFLAIRVVKLHFRSNSIRSRLVMNYLWLVAAGDANRKWSMAIQGPIPDLNRK